VSAGRHSGAITDGFFPTLFNERLAATDSGLFATSNRKRGDMIVPAFSERSGPSRPRTEAGASEDYVRAFWTVLNLAFALVPTA